MCGIVGYVGDGDAAAFLLEGLSRLEYRGYDSSGIAVYDGAKICVKKSVGRLAELKTKLAGHTPEGALGIGHTRWATHGRPSDLNAHPHTDCTGDFAVVHNGIIENFMALKEELLAKGHIFKSETDTEVLAHLLEEAYDGDFEAAVRAVLRRLERSAAPAARTLTRGSLTLLLDEERVLIAGQAIILTKKEFDILCLLAENKSRVFSRDHLLESLWGYDYEGDTRTVDTHIKRLRAKLAKALHPDWEIRTVWGVGYAFEVIP